MNNEEKPVYYVYLHNKKSNGITFYVGVGKGKRCKNFTNRSAWWKATRDKHGVVVKILKSNLSFEESRDLEIKTILKLRSEGNILCNITDGGGGRRGFKLSDDVKKRISESNIGKNKGKKASLETKAILSALRVGKKRKPETLKKMSEAQKGIPKKYPSPMKGKKMSEDQKIKLRIPKSQETKDKLRVLALARSSKGMHPCWCKTIYSFKCIETNDIFKGTRKDFENKFGIKINALFGSHKKVQKVCKGWKLID